MIVFLIILLILVLSFSFGMEVKKEKTLLYNIIFVVVFITSVLLALFLPPGSLISEAQLEELLAIDTRIFEEGFTTFETLSPEIIKEYIDEITRVFVGLLFMLTFYIVFYLAHIIVYFKNKFSKNKEKKDRSTKPLNFLEGFLSLVKAMVLIASTIVPCSYIVETYSYAKEILVVENSEEITQNYTVLEDYGKIFTFLDSLEKDKLIKLSGNDFSYKMMDKVSKGKSSEMLRRIVDGKEMIDILMNDPSSKALMDEDFSIKDIDQVDIDFNNLKALVNRMLESPLYKEIIVDLVNSVYEWILYDLKEEFPDFNEKGIYYDEVKLKIDIHKLLDIAQFAVEKKLYKLLDENGEVIDITSNLTTIGNVIKKISSSELNAIVLKISTIEIINTAHPFVMSVSSGFQNWAISNLVSPYIITATYIINKAFVVLDKMFETFKLTKVYQFMVDYQNHIK